MKKIRLINIGLLSLCLISYASPVVAPKITVRDSLFEMLIGPTTPDTSKVLSSIALAEYFRFTDLDSARLFAEQAISLAQKVKFRKGEAYAFSVHGLPSKDQRNTTQTIEFFNTSLKLLNASGDTLSTGNVYNNMGLTWDDAGNMVEAEKSPTQALAIFTRYKNNWGIGRTYIDFGQMSRKQGLYFTALDYYFKALPIFEADSSALDQLGNVYANIGTAYKNLEKYKDAIVYQERQF